jgi:hypothetical protein
MHIDFWCGNIYKTSTWKTGGMGEDGVKLELRYVVRMEDNGTISE